MTDRPETRFAAGGRLHLESGEPLVIRSSRPVDDGPGWWLTFEGRPERSFVEGLRGRYLEADVDPADVHASGAALWDEVVGCEVRDLEGRLMGSVVDIYRAGGAEVYVVAGGPFGSFDVPSVRDYVRVFAPERREIVVDAAALDLAPEERPNRAERRPPRWSRHGRGAPAPAPEPPAGSDDAADDAPAD